MWADARETFFGDGQNRRSLALVESALLWLSLEDGAPPLLDWSARGKALIHGDPAKPSIWFDKSLSLLVFADGQVCVGRAGPNPARLPACSRPPTRSPVRPHNAL